MYLVNERIIMEEFMRNVEDMCLLFFGYPIEHSLDSFDAVDTMTINKY